LRPVLMRAMVAFLAASCSPNFDEPSLVKDLRILAVRADRPEFFVGGSDPTEWPVTLTVLLADPAGAGRTLSCAFRWCRLTESNTCDGVADAVPLGEGPCAHGETAFDLRIPATVVQAVQAEDPTYGTPVHSGVAVWVEVVVRAPERTLLALKSVVFSPPNPPDRTPNRNPRIAALRLNDMPPAEPDLIPFSPRESVLIEVVPSDDSKERYLLPTLMPPGGVTEQEEPMTVAFYADAGSFEDATRSDKPSSILSGPPTAEEAKLRTKWTPPAEAREVQFWFVLTDERGGVDWLLARGVLNPR